MNYHGFLNCPGFQPGEEENIPAPLFGAIFACKMQKSWQKKSILKSSNELKYLWFIPHCYGQKKRLHEEHAAYENQLNRQEGSQPHISLYFYQLKGSRIVIITWFHQINTWWKSGHINDGLIICNQFWKHQTAGNISDLYHTAIG